MLSFARVRALAIVVLLIAGAVVAVVSALVRDAENAPMAERCPEGFAIADLELPAESTVRINVYNATEQVGMASRVAEHFANRGFEVVEHDDDPRDREVEGVAELRYGPQAVGAAQLLRAYFLNLASREFEIGREDDVVDVVIGSEFRQLATPTEVAQSIAQIGTPELPPGTCAAG